MKTLADLVKEETLYVLYKESIITCKSSYAEVHPYLYRIGGKRIDEETTQIKADNNIINITTGLEKIRHEFPNLTVRVSNDLAKIIRTAKEKQSVRYDAVIDERFSDILYPFQIEGVNTLLNSDGRFILGDDMGLGKTLQTIVYIESLSKAFTQQNEREFRVLIICPASLKLNWRKEIKQWTEEDAYVIDSSCMEDLWDYERVTLTDDFKVEPITEHKKNKYFVVNYEILKKLNSTLMAQGFDMVVVDEFHYIKNGDSDRTQNVHALINNPFLAELNVPYVVLLSGTPILNRPVELYSPLRLINPTKYGKNKMPFCTKYCNPQHTRYGWDFSGSTNIPQLREEIKDIYLRRKKEEVLQDLPSKTRQFILLNKNDLPQEHIDGYKELLPSMLETLKDTKGMISWFGYIQTMRSKLSMSKVKTVVDMVQNDITEGHKVVVFSQYLDVFASLKRRFRDTAVGIRGDTEAEERSNAVEEFQTNDEVKVFIGTKAAWVGLTLTAGDIVYFLDFDWTPANHLQAEDRCLRIGQKNNVLVRYILVEKSIDDYFLRMLQEKSVLVNTVIDGEDCNEFSEQNEETVVTTFYNYMKENLLTD